MDRRSAFKGISGLLAAASGLMVGIPGIGFFLTGVLRSSGRKALVQRVARLRNLAPGKPVQVPLVGERQDGWTSHAQEVIGRVWLLRGNEEFGPDNLPTVTALAAVCPHLG